MKSHRLSSRRGIVWRSDLVRSELVFGAGTKPSADWLKLVHSLGFDREILTPAPESASLLAEELDRIRTQIKGDIPQVKEETPEPNPRLFSWVPKHYSVPPWSIEEIGFESRLASDSGTVPIVLQKSFDRAPPMRYLASWSQLRTRLQPLLQRPFLTRHLDEKKLIKMVTLRIPISRIPRKIRKRIPERLHVIADTNKRCSMLAYDQQMVIDRLSRELPTQNREFYRATDPNFEYPYLNPKKYRKNSGVDDPASHVLILGDLGILDRSRRDDKEVWVRWVYEQWNRGTKIFALVPYSLDLFPEWLKTIVHPVAWQGNEIRQLEGDDSREDLLKTMFVYAYPAIRIELQLLRALRLMIPNADDASLESLFWQHPNLADNALLGAKNDKPSKEKAFRHLFEELPAESRKMILETIRSYRQDPKSIADWYLEFANLSEGSRKSIDTYQDDSCGMVDTIHRYRRRLESGHLELGDRDRMTWYVSRATEDALSTVDVSGSIRFIREYFLPEMNRHRSTRMSEVHADGTPRQLRLKATFDGLESNRYPTVPLEPSTVVSVRSTSRLVEVHVPTEELSKVKSVSPEQAFWKLGKKPDWVSDFGIDEYGAWCEFQVPRHDGKGMVTQRMRWIKPGQFMMGSPDKEEGRFADESPQHRVTLTQGYWMADSQVTQELWMAISGGENPSLYEGAANPVEQVSWEDCKAWISKLGLHHESFKISLPTEAQWEYACRAGSTTAYCFGDDAKELPKYGWFDENSKSTTHPVKQLQPNDWGLYDMHGNGWEWCSDWSSAYKKSATSDPTGPANGAFRVLRGGSWFDPARVLRSAGRFRLVPGYRNFYLGFRLLSSAQGAEPSERAMLPVAEQGTELARIGSAEPAYEFLRSVDLDATGENSPEEEFAEIDMNAYTSIRVVSDQEGYQFDRLEKPIWAVEFGSDSYGLHASFELSTVRQRMRWIPPGRFLMGSPEGKDYGRGNEYPQHEVIITNGYWMFDTPCTQQLWSALMGENPSYFPDEDRPVEKVRWEDAVEFARKLNERLAEGYPKDGRRLVEGWDRLMFRLPTEAEWEYACRAGTTADTYAGDLEIQGDANAPLLDSIGWYGGNSGHEYDLKESYSLEQTWLKERQYPEKAGGTRKVGFKAPNAWGLYDMLGNVWEWCQDWYGNYPTELTERMVDPTGPAKGSVRVIRGGSWFHPARYLRSACRSLHDPGLRNYYLGFRLLSSAHQAVQATESDQEASLGEVASGGRGTSPTTSDEP